MSTLTLELLGSPRLVSPDGEVVLNNGLPVVLLAYLALEDHPISRDHLAELFWPGLERRRQLHNLRQSLLRLRIGHHRDMIEGQRELWVRPGALVTDVSRFLALVSEGRVEEGVALWRGSFLHGFRRARSWELEDWIDRRRGMLETTLVEAASEEARRRLQGGAPASVLSLLEMPRRLIPDHEELGALEVLALARLGRRAEAEAVLRTLELEVGSDLEMAAAEALLAAPGARAGEPVTLPDTPAALADHEPHRDPDRGEGGGATSEPPPSEPHPSAVRPSEPVPSGRRSFGIGRKLAPWLAVAALLALLSVSVLRRLGPGATIHSNEEAGLSLLVCANWATGGTVLQPYRMSPDGADKHRLSDAALCQSAWVAEAAALFGPVPDRDPESRLVRLTPDPNNPIAEWALAEVESARHLRGPWISRGNPKIGPGGVLVFSAEDEEGNRDIYALETGSERLSRLTTSPAVDEWPTLDPDGDRVIFSSRRSGDGDLYSVKLDGTGLTQLTRHPLRDGRPWVWGDSVLFVRGQGMGPEDGNMELVLLDLSSGSETQLTDNDWNDYEQMWSPDGRYICWQSERLGHYESDIMVMDLARGRSWDATEAPGRESDCRWTGTGNGLLYIHFVEGEGSDVFLQSLRGASPVNLTRYPGHESVVGFFRMPGTVGARGGR